jgi:hypothetical protein
MMRDRSLKRSADIQSAYEFPTEEEKKEDRSGHTRPEERGEPRFRRSSQVRADDERKVEEVGRIRLEQLLHVL